MSLTAENKTNVFKTELLDFVFIFRLSAPIKSFPAPVLKPSVHVVPFFSITLNTNVCYNMPNHFVRRKRTTWVYLLAQGCQLFMKGQKCQF